MRSWRLACLSGLLVLASLTTAPASPGSDLRAAYRELRQRHYQSVIALTARALNSGALRLNDAAYAYNLRGLALKNMGWAYLAVDDLNTALRLSPCYAAALINRGLVWMNVNKYRRAEADFTAAIKCRRGSVAKAYNNRGAVYFLDGHPVRAVADFTRAIKLRPGYVIAYYNRALAYQRWGQLCHSLVRGRFYLAKAAADWQHYQALLGRK